MTNTQRAIAAKKLHNAYMHLCGRGIENVRAAQDVLMEAERYVCNGFKMPSNQYWNDSIETVFRLWKESRG